MYGTSGNPCALPTGLSTLVHCHAHCQAVELLSMCALVAQRVGTGSGQR